MSFHEKTALITGASKGIGKEIAFELGKRGYNLLLVARNKVLLKEVKKNIQLKYPKIKIDYFVADLSLAEDIERLKIGFKEGNYSLHFLVNNAGYTIWKDFKDTPIENHLNLLHLNVEAILRLTHFFIPFLMEQKKSYIMNIASTAAYQAIPTMAIYGATKAFVLSFSRALHLELEKTPIGVTCISPGVTQTNFAERGKMEKLQKTAEKFSMSAQKVAQKAVEATLNGEKEKIIGFLNRVSTQLTYFLPKKVSETIAKKVFDTKKNI